MMWVPTVDLQHGDASSMIDEACRRAGFFTITGHGIDRGTSSAVWETARRFFDLPVVERMAVAMPYAGYPYGYSPLAGESLAASLDQVTPADLKESFAIGPVTAPAHVITDPDESFAWSANLWPVGLPEMRPAWERYFTAMSELSARVLSLMAAALDLPAGWFAPMIDRHTSAMRALSYPVDVRPRPGQLGAGEHTDYGTITILLADPHQAGLEIEGPGGVWHPVEPVAGSYVVNLGDAMARWTNDRWRSTLHRVQVPSGRRQSIAFFHNANWDAVIECLPSCLEPGEVPRYPPMAAGPHLMSKFTSTVARSAI